MKKDQYSRAIEIIRKRVNRLYIKEIYGKNLRFKERRKIDQKIQEDCITKVRENWQNDPAGCLFAPGAWLIKLNTNQVWYLCDLKILADIQRMLDRNVRVKHKLYICPACGGDGIETCDNPDHGFIQCVGGDISRLGCPACGHDPDHKIDEKCPICDGRGIATYAEITKNWKRNYGYHQPNLSELEEFDIMDPTKSNK